LISGQNPTPIPKNPKRNLKKNGEQQQEEETREREQETMEVSKTRVFSCCEKGQIQSREGISPS